MLPVIPLVVGAAEALGEAIPFATAAAEATAATTTAATAATAATATTAAAATTATTSTSAAAITTPSDLLAGGGITYSAKKGAEWAGVPLEKARKISTLDRLAFIPKSEKEKYISELISKRPEPSPIPIFKKIKEFAQDEKQNLPSTLIGTHRGNIGSYLGTIYGQKVGGNIGGAVGGQLGGMAQSLFLGGLRDQVKTNFGSGGAKLFDAARGSISAGMNTANSQPNPSISNSNISNGNYGGGRDAEIIILLAEIRNLLQNKTGRYGA